MKKIPVCRSGRRTAWVGLGHNARRFLAILFAGLVLFSVVQVASAITTTIQPSSADSDLDQSTPDGNTGTEPSIAIDAMSGSEFRGIVMFSLSDIPAGAKVTSATLSLYVESKGTTSGTVGVHRVTSSWTESGVTWNTRYGTTAWTTSGGDFDTAATDETDVTEVGWSSWTVTSDVRGFVNGTYSNHGWILKYTASGSSRYANFDSRTGTNTPKLSVTYYTPTVTSCDSAGNEINEFAPGEKVYVKAEWLEANTIYKIWIQNYTVNEEATLQTNKDESGAQENVTTDTSGRFGYGAGPNPDPVEIWNISSTAAVTHHEHDIVIDKQSDGADTGKYNAASDGIDSSASVVGITAPVPDVSSLILFASGLVLLISVYFVYGRRRKEG